MIHTQNIESYNNKVKLRIKQVKGIKATARSDFLLEFMWLDNFANDSFTKTIELIKMN